MTRWWRRSRVAEDPAPDDRRVAVIVRASDSELRVEMPLNDDWTLASLHEFARDLGDRAGIVAEGPAETWVGVMFPPGTGGRGLSGSERDGLRALNPERGTILRRIRMSINKKRRRLAGLGVLLLLAAGVAAAAWLLSTTGPGAGKIGTLQSITVTAGPTGAGIMPNSSGDLAVHLNSPNEQPLKVIRVESTGDPFSLMGSGSLGACGASDINGALAVSDKTLTTPVVVAPGQSDVVLPGVIAAGDISNGCQGQAFTVPVRLSVST
jgi:hypothetical protein